MNERIQELMKQSMVEYQFDMRFSPEKFAELIVQECIKINHVETSALDLPEYNLGVLEGYRRARENMSVHFGILN